MIAKPWTLVCCNIPSISLHLFISLFAIFPNYFHTSLSHYLRYFPNISALFHLIICDISQISPQLFISLFARLEQPLIGGSRPPGKKSLLEEILERTGERKSTGAKSRLFLFSLTELFLPRPNFYSAPAFSTKGHVLVSSGVNTGNYEDARLLIKTFGVPQILLIKARHKTWIRSGGTRSISIV